MQTNTPQTTQQPNKNSKGSNIALIIIIVILALFVIGGGITYYVYYRAKKAVQKITETASNNANSSTIEEGKLPSADAEGKDLTNIPRYPDSIRSSYYQDPDTKYTSINYRIAASSEEILNYYKKQMPTLGWTLMASEAKNLTYNQDGVGQLSININSTVNSITDYSLEFWPATTE